MLSSISDKSGGYIKRQFGIDPTHVMGAPPELSLMSTTAKFPDCISIYSSHVTPMRTVLHKRLYQLPLKPFTLRPLPSTNHLYSRTAATMANIHTPIPNLKLNDGNSIPMLGYGTGTAWYKSGDESQLDQACVDATKTAIKLGYYHLDGAEVYKTEPELGKAITESGVDREKLFVTTKVLPNIADIPAALAASLKKLQVEYVDLYLIHAPFFGSPEESPEALQKAWKAMEEVKEAGLTKSIGVSNFLPQHLDAIVKTARIPPAINQIEFHAYLQHRELLNYHKEKGIATEAYGPLTPATKAAPGPLDNVLAGLSKKYAVSPGEICLRYCIDQDIVAITTSSKEQRLSDYLRAMTFKLTPREVNDLNEAGSQKHFRGFWNHKFADNDRR
jgi:diketogulonate reductase-like aldo/keto reductase